MQVVRGIYFANFPEQKLEPPERSNDTHLYMYHVYIAAKY
jgi:hypothetical protein